jgi:hypothetical protein
MANKLPMFGRYGETQAKLIEAKAPVSWPAGLDVLPVRDVETHVLAQAGARPWDRDEHDIRVLFFVAEGRGEIIDDEKQVGGYPHPASTQAPFVEAEWNLDTMEPRSGAYPGQKGPIQVASQRPRPRDARGQALGRAGASHSFGRDRALAQPDEAERQRQRRHHNYGQQKRENERPRDPFSGRPACGEPEDGKPADPHCIGDRNRRPATAHQARDYSRNSENGAKQKQASFEHPAFVASDREEPLAGSSRRPPLQCWDFACCTCPATTCAPAAL